jgi:hypothetical protein
MQGPHSISLENLLEILAGSLKRTSLVYFSNIVQASLNYLVPPRLSGSTWSQCYKTFLAVIHDFL